MKNILTENEYWNKLYHKDRKLPIKEDFNNCAFRELDLLFKKYLPVNKNMSMIELGCAPGSWLHYFNTSFKYRVDGIDYTSDGVNLTKKNLSLLKIDSNIINGDIFKYNFITKYDIVFSAGLIEHFEQEDLELIIGKHIEACKINGFIIFLIPNVQGFNKIYGGFLDKNSLLIHNLKIMNLEFFENFKFKFMINPISIGYRGRINFGLFTCKYLSILRIGYLIQIIIDIFYFLFKIKIPENRYTSPYIVAIYKKEGELQ